MGVYKQMTTISAINSEKTSPKKNPRVNLTVGDLNDLSHNRMLNNNIIQTFQQMLKIK